jgi:DNA-binding beta-propeller fold protein YncE
MIQYSIDIKVEYTNNYEYRLCLRDLFNIDKKVYEDKIKNIDGQ